MSKSFYNVSLAFYFIGYRMNTVVIFQDNMRFQIGPITCSQGSPVRCSLYDLAKSLFFLVKVEISNSSF